MPTRRRARAGALLGAVLSLPGAALAETPLSAIDWLRNGHAVTLPRTVLMEPPVTDTAARPEIEVSPLEDLRLPLGLVSPQVTGLPVTLWDTSPVEVLTQEIARAPVARSAAMRTLLYTLLLTEARAPAHAGAEEALLLARIDRLMDLGAVDPAQALAALAGPSRSAALFARWFDASLLTGDEDVGCAMLKDLPHLAPDQAAAIFCTARRGDWETAALMLEAAHALEVLPRERLDLLDRFLSPDVFEDAPPLPAPGTAPSPLDFRLFEAIGERLPTTSLPRAFATADLRDVAGWKAQLEAAERLTRYGALSANQFLGLYTERRPAASGGVWDRVAALQRFETALGTGSAQAVAKTLPTVWQAMRGAGLAVPFAELFADRLAALPGLDPETAALAWRIALLSPGYEAAARRPPDDRADHGFLAALAQGRPDRAPPPDPRAETVAEGFRDPAALPADLRTDYTQGRLGAVILALIARFDSGLRGNSGDLVAALSGLRAVGLEDTARRAALQYLLLERG